MKILNIAHQIMAMLVLCALSACATTGDPGTASGDAANSDQPVKDAWIDTRLETAYLFNRHLNNFGIQTDVDDGNVLLTGIVRSEIDRNLAEEIALSVNGVKSVRNHLTVRESIAAAQISEEDRTFVRKVDDVTTTALVKSRLLANDNLNAADIDVDTVNLDVTLTGQVPSLEEKQLAELIAGNTSDVASVRNRLQVVPREPQAKTSPNGS